MKSIKIYTMKFCPHCEFAKRLFVQKKLSFDEIVLDMDDDGAWKKLEKQTGFKTVPQIFIGERFVGGYTELLELDKNGELENWLK